MPARFISLQAAHLLALALVVGAARAQPAPTVSGPDTGQTTLGVALPGPNAHTLKNAIELAFEGDCLKRDELAASVERWLEQDLVSARVTVSVTGEQSPALAARFWVLVDEQRASLRRFEDFEGTCEELSSALSAAIALALEAVDLSQFPAPAPKKPKPLLPVARLTARSPLQRDIPPRPPKVQRRRPGLIQRLSLGAQVLGGVGIGPASALGVGARSDVGFPKGVAIRFGASYVQGDPVPLADGTLTVTALVGQTGLCWGGQAPEVSARVCLDAWGGAMTAHPVNLERPRRATLPWVALAPGAEVSFLASESFGMHIGAHLAFSVVRPRFEVLYNTHDELLDHRKVPPLGFLGVVGLDWLLL